MLTPTGVVLGTVILATMGTMENQAPARIQQEDQPGYGYRRLNPL